MINVFAILSFIKNQWLGFVVMLLWLLTLIVGQKDLAPLIEKRNVLDKNTLNYNKKIDTIYIENLKIKNRIKYIKQKENDTIRIIDTMSISELQEYFSDRYNKKDSLN